MEWYSLFRPHILDRGAEYHQDGYVTKFQLTDGYIEAEVEGTETYNVEIELDGEMLYTCLVTVHMLTVVATVSIWLQFYFVWRKNFLMKI